MPRANRADLAPVFKDPKLLRAMEEVVNGALVAGALEAGAQAPTLGANKPGTAGGDPAIWVPVTINGVRYGWPLWLLD